MRNCFIPTYFDKDMNIKLQHLTRGSEIVEEYHKEMELTMIWARVEERSKTTMA